MSEPQDKNSKTEAPTQHRLDEAFKEGQFAQAPEITMVAVLGAAYTLLLTSGEHLGNLLIEKAEFFFTHFYRWDVNSDSLLSGGIAIIEFILTFLAPIAIACLTAAIISGGMQTQFRLTPQAILPKPSRLDPIQGLKNLFGMSAWVRFGIDLLKFGIIGSLLWFFIKGSLDDPIFHFQLPISALSEFISDTSMKLLGKLVSVLGMIAALHYLYQKHKLLQDLKMTPDEIKQEQKMFEMNPLLKQARRRFARKILTRQMLDQIPFADVVIRNPTHYAIALQYDKKQGSAPIVISKGENAMAARILSIAETHGVPKVENAPVARLLFKMCKVGSPIPMDLYHAVAEILAYVYKTHRYYFYRLKARRLKL